jgi:hypothetical protein
MPRSGRRRGGRVGRMPIHQGERRDQCSHRARSGRRADHTSTDVPSLRLDLHGRPRQRQVLLAALSPGAMASTSSGPTTPALLFALRSPVGRFPFAQAVLLQRLPTGGLPPARQNGRPIMSDCHRVTLSRRMVTVRRQIVTLPATLRRICRGKCNGSFLAETAKMAAEPVASYIRLCLLTRTKTPPPPEAHPCH